MNQQLPFRNYVTKMMGFLRELNREFDLDATYLFLTRLSFARSNGYWGELVGSYTRILETDDSAIRSFAFG